MPRTPLIGRGPEVARVCELLETYRLVTITGQGGVGKTRVAIEVAGRQARRVVFVSLADLDRSAVAGAIFRACTSGTPSRLSGPIASGANIVTEVWSGLAQEIARDPLVLVLDTFEHVNGAAALVSQIQSAIPDLAVLVTSRCRLGLRDERVVPLAGLSSEQGGAAVQLFHDRWRAVGGDRHPRTDSDAPVLEICRLLGGVPLAIELAAARTALMSPVALLAQFRQPADGRVLGLLAHGPVDLPTRQLSMRAAMSWSYQLLDDPQQTLFRRLGVFPTSFCLDAAEKVCTGIGPDGDWLAPDALLNGIAALVELHLVEPLNDAGQGGTDPEDARFAMHGAPRAYAVELLEMSGEDCAVRGRLHDWAIDFGRQAERGVASPDERAWLARIDDELPLIRQALTCFAQNSEVARGVALATGIAGFWTVRGPLAEALQWFRTFLDIDGGNGGLPEQLRAVAVSWAHRLGLESGDLQDIGETRNARAMILAHPCSAQLWLRSTDHLVYGLINELGAVSADTPQTTSPTEILAECLALVAEGIGRARSAHDSYWLSHYLFLRAQLEWMSGRRDALSYAEEAFAVSRDNQHLRIAAKSQALVAVCRMAQDDWTGARESMLVALDHLRVAGDLAGAVDALTALGVILVELGDMAGAAGFLRDAITEARCIGYGQGEIYGAWTVAYLACRHGLHTEAATMDDALAEHMALVERGLPRDIFLGYLESIASARVAAGLPPSRQPGGRGWGWLRARALEISTLVAAGGLGKGAAMTPAAISSTSVPVTQPTTAGAKQLSAAKGPPRVPEQSPRNSARGSHRHELTARELQILSAIASGQTNAQIAAMLFLSAKTVMHHSTSIYRKLEVGGRAEAVALAYRTGLLHTPAR